MFSNDQSPGCAQRLEYSDPLGPTFPSSRERWKLYLLIGVAVVSVVQFIWWLVAPEHIGDPWIFWLLIASFGYKILFWLYEWYLYLGITIPPRPALSRTWSVDVFTTACPGEPEEMIVNTLRAMVAIRYPHRSYLCDEGDSPTLKRVCDELGVIHVTRSERKDAKAGNINNGLAKSGGEICVVSTLIMYPVRIFLTGCWAISRTRAWASFRRCRAMPTSPTASSRAEPPSRPTCFTVR